MSSHEAGVKILKALAKYSDYIMDAYEGNNGRLSGSIAPKAHDDLLRLRLAVMDSSDGKVRLNFTVMGLLDQSLRSSRLKMVNANIGEAIEGIEFLAGEYISSKQAGSEIDAESYLRDLDGNVSTLCDNLVDQAREIWRQIDSDFGSVSLLSSKIALNKNALIKVNKLLKSLELIDLDSISSLSSHDKQLRKLLQVKLPASIEDCRKDLGDAIHRLNKILFKLSKLEARAKMVNEIVQHCEENSGLKTECYADRIDVPRLFRASLPMEPTGHIDPFNTTLEFDYAEILNGLRKEEPPHEPQTVNHVPTDIEDNSEETLVVAPFKTAVVDVFVACLEREEPVSGADCFRWAPEGMDINIWLYALIAEFNALNHDQRQHFNLEYIGEIDKVFNGNFRAEDVLICPA